MKYIITASVGVLVFFAGIFFWRSVAPEEPAITPPAPSPTATHVQPTTTVTVNSETYSYAIVRATPRTVSLLPNFSARTTTSDLMAKDGCTAGINGGFYDTSNRPLGYFFAQGKLLRDRSGSTLINGYIAVDTKEFPTISQAIPEGQKRFALQTGPILLFEGKPAALRLKNDEHARRSIAALTHDRAFVFLVVYSAESTFEGPLLVDLPDIVGRINEKESLSLDAAINLDGGSASAFYGGGVNLSELTPVGSFFCIIKG